jgi:hypothetical protein
MLHPKYDVFVLETTGTVRWIEAAPSLEDAKKLALETPSPAESHYLILDHNTGNKYEYVVDPKAFRDALTEIQKKEDPTGLSVPSMRRPIHVKSFFALSMSSSLFFPFSQAASVATLPSALLYERFSLGASWVFSIH